MNKITSVCVYCASSTKIDSAYFEAARELGTLLGQRHIRLINGAGGIGLMSATADAVLAASLFHYKELEISQVKDYLAGKGVPVRR